MIFTNVVLGLNPDFDKRRLFFQKSILDREDYYENAKSNISLKNKFLLHNVVLENEEYIIKAIKDISFLQNDWNGYNSFPINPKTINNSIKIIKSLSPSVLYYLKPENIYPSKTGTIIMDWEFDKENILSLEIAKKAVGYFVELNGKDYKQIDRIEIEKIKEITYNINNDLSIFI